MSLKLAHPADSYRTPYPTGRAVWTGWTGKPYLSSVGAVTRNWTSTPRTAFGQSIEADSTIFGRMANYSLNGEATHGNDVRSRTLPRDNKRQNKSISEDQLSLPTKRNEETVKTNQAPIELRVLARLELKKRQLLKELAEVESQHRHFSRENELKGIPIPWFT
jgi:hypothetical protein